MTREYAASFAIIVAAFTNGATVQYRSERATNWVTLAPDVGWGLIEGYEWRVKPPEPKEVWVRDGGSIAWAKKETVIANIAADNEYAGTFRLYREVEGVKL